MWPGDGTVLATCGGGAEEVLAAEIRNALKLEPTINRGAVSFAGRAPEVVAANLQLRSASRILLRVAEGRISSYEDLYRLVRRLPWHRWIPPSLTIAVTATCRDRSLTDYRSVALKTKDAIVDAQRVSGKRSSVDRRQPDVPLHVFVQDGTATLSLDSSGAPLHERGYRRSAGEAPMRETVAATILLQTGWTGTGLLLDPFCGAGTIAIEAAMIAQGIPPGSLGRSFAYERWPWFPQPSRATPAAPGELQVRRPARIVARDNDPIALVSARANAERAGVLDNISLEQEDFFEAAGPDGKGMIVTNPPYGERLELEEAGEFYRRLGARLREAYSGWTAWILSGNRPAAKQLGLKPRSRTPVWHGGLDARLYQVELYEQERNGQ